jgi:putative transposase
MISLYDKSGRGLGGETMLRVKVAHFPLDMILTCVRWYVAYPLSYHQVEELMQERGVAVDHATINRWVVKYNPQLEEAFHRRKRLVLCSWRLDETYIRVRGCWCYLYRAVDKAGQTIDFLLTEQRDEHAAMRFLTKAIRRHGVPETITIDGSEANAAAIRAYNEARHGDHHPPAEISEEYDGNSLYAIDKNASSRRGDGWRWPSELPRPHSARGPDRSGVPPGSVSVRMWYGQSPPAPADRRQRWIVPSQPAVRVDPLAPQIASPASPSLGASVRVPGVAAGIRLKGSRPASMPPSGARADWSHA